MRFEADDASVEDTPEIRALGEVFSRADDMDAAELGEAVHAILETTHVRWRCWAAPSLWSSVCRFPADGWRCIGVHAEAAGTVGGGWGRGRPT